MALLVEYISHIVSIVNCERTSTSIVLEYLVVNFWIWNSSVFLPAALMCLVLALMYPEPEASTGFSSFKSGCPALFLWFPPACFEN